VTDNDLVLLIDERHHVTGIAIREQPDLIAWFDPTHTVRSEIGRDSAFPWVRDLVGWGIGVSRSGR
jgi:hypothetical protein